MTMAPESPASVTIRPAYEADIPALLVMIGELTALHRGVATVGEEDLRRDGFGPDPLFRALVAELDGQRVGYAIYFFRYRAHVGRASLQLHQFHVRPGARRHGVGRALMRALAGIAADRLCAAVWLNVEPWNEAAREFYESLGFRRDEPETALSYFLDGPGIQALAREPGAG